MNKFVGLTKFVALGVLLCLPLAPAQKGTASDSSCETIIQALLAHGKIKPGMKRRDVEKNFQQAGGMTFRFATDYVYSKCEYIEVRTDFEAGPDVKGVKPRGDFPENDIVKNVGKLTLGYPTRD
jgi:hypothetical protein